VAAKYISTGNQRSFYLLINTDGTLWLVLDPDGTGGALVTAKSTAAPGFTNFERNQIRVTWSAATGKANFYKWSAGAWVIVGSPDVALVCAGIYQGTAPLEIGSYSGGGSNFSGVIYSASIRIAIDGAAVDMDPTQWTTGTTFSSGGVTWTLNGNSFIQNTGVDCVTTIGSNALETAAGQTIASPATVFAVARFTNAAPGASQNLFDGRSSGTYRMAILSMEGSSDRFGIYQGGAGAPVPIAEAYDTSLHVFTGQFNGDSTTTLAVSGLGSVSGDVGAGSFDALTMFAAIDGSQSAQVIFADFIVIPGSVPSAYVTAINAYLKALYGTV